MKTSKICSIVSNLFITKDTFLMNVEFDEIPQAGQFLMLSKTDGLTMPFLPRPISVFDWNDGILSLLVKVVGKGTKMLSEMKPGEKIRITGYLGNSFPDTEGTLLCIGGGIGAAPLFYTAKISKAEKKHFILGFRDKDSVLMEEKFRELGEVTIVTDDGSYGLKKYPHEVLETMLEKGLKPSEICTCGPLIMMDCVEKTCKKFNLDELYKSYETTMGCGIGACLGCRIETPGGSFLVCKEGPVFKSK